MRLCLFQIIQWAQNNNLVSCLYDLFIVIVAFISIIAEAVISQSATVNKNIPVADIVGQTGSFEPISKDINLGKIPKVEPKHKNNRWKINE